MPKFSKAYFCDPKNYDTTAIRVSSKEPVPRRDYIFKINEINPYLAVLCLKEFRRGFKEELRASVKKQALQQIQNVTEPRIVTNAFFALYELEEYDGISRFFRLVQDPEQITSYQPIIQGIFSNSKDSNLLFRFLDILFENLPTNTPLNKSPAHTLWLLALEKNYGTIAIWVSSCRLG